MLEPIAIEKLQNLVNNLLFTKYLTKGGQKIVYLATLNEVEVVAKIIIPPNGLATKRVKRELDIMKNVSSPNIVKLIDFFDVNIDGKNALIIIEEFVQGYTLNKIIEKGCADRDFIFVFFDTFISILEELENLQIVHRDIKPSNIIVSDSNKITLLDFGIARALNEDSITSDFAQLAPCTIAYASPEQLTNNKPSQDHRTDFFSLGLVLFEIVTGFHPFKGKESNDEFDFIDAILQDNKHLMTDFMESNEFNLELNNIYLKLSAKQPFQRYRKTSFIKSDIEKLRSIK